MEGKKSSGSGFSWFRYVTALEWRLRACMMQRDIVLKNNESLFALHHILARGSTRVIARIVNHNPD
jgi:hypothetical protein